MQRNSNLTVFCLSFFMFASLAQSQDQAEPEWIHQQSRQVVGGDILSLGAGEGNSIEISRFKAEAMAVKGLISECSLAHRDIIIWDRYFEKVGSGYKSYARAGLLFEACQEAKRVRGEERKSLSNAELLKNQDIYSQIEGLHVVAPALTPKSEPRENSIGIKRLKELEDKIIKIEQMKALPVQTILIKETTVQYDRAPPNQARYNDCMLDYRQLMNDASQSANDIGVPRGNMASPNVSNKLNRAEEKLRYCSGLRGR